MAANQLQENGPYGPYRPSSTDNGNIQDPTEYQSPYGNIQTPSYNVPVQRTALTQQDFLNRVTYINEQIDSLTSNISGIASVHQRAIWSQDDPSHSATLESLTTSTQVLITKIKDQIKYLETESAKAQYSSIRDSQLRSLKNQLKTKLSDYREEEITYKRRYEEQIARQYKIINPDATESEIQEAVEADWGDEGIFQRAVSFTVLI
jgi:syntaxin 1B/2/3